MTTKPCLIAIVAVALAAGCNPILGINKDPTLVDGGAGADVPNDIPTDVPIDMPMGQCVPASCPFGCDPRTDACRDGKVWVFLTIGATFANAFGGLDTPPSVRGGGDALCFNTYSQRHAARGCARGNVHAVLHVNSTDSLAGMASNFGIPTAAPVHRATDDVLVANNWTDLLDQTLQPRAPVFPPSVPPVAEEGFIWTGANTTATCQNWTQRVGTMAGVRGDATLTAANWINRAALACDRLAKLLCVCFSPNP